MPSSNLFAVSNEGRVFALQTDGAVWEELPYLGIDFKRVSAHDSVVWALGGDHQVYVFVYGTSVPIRVCEEAFENQRWNPIEGFTSNLLPSDRPVFSSIDGLEDRKLTDIHLPSLAWNWEGPWHLQDTFDGKALDKECWTYAVDFPRSFYAEKSWKSCVRRRKWVRYRRYIALDTWSAVSSIHKDHTQEPFIDIGVGGGDVIGEDSDRLMVWGITAFGKVAVREGICATCPEGSKWTFVATPGDQDVTCLSVGRSGKVWALTWDGTALVRTGVCRDFPLGVSWTSVEPPGSPLNQIAVGNEVVWAVCRDSTVWFRRGLDFDHTSRYHGNSEVGTSWLQMTGSLLMISVGPSEQVWGITVEDYELVIRTGVTSSELTGKMWKAINLPLKRFDPDERSPLDEGHFHCPSSSSSPSSDLSYRGSHFPKDKEAHKLLELPKESPCSGASLEIESQDTLSMNTDILGSEGSDPKDPSKLSPAPYEDSPCSKEDEARDQLSSLASQGDCKTPPIPIVESKPVNPSGPSSSNDFSSLRMRSPSEVPDSMTSSVTSDTVVNFIGSYLPCDDAQPPVLKPRRDLIEPLEGDSVGAAGSEGRRSVSSEGSEAFVPGGDRGNFLQEDRSLFPLTLPQQSLWMWVSGSGCWVQANNMPKWFLADYASFNTHEPWRQAILQKLSQRQKSEVDGFSSYEEAIECSSWVVNRQCRYLVRGQWVPASLELQMSGSKVCQVQEASLKILYTDALKKTVTLIPCCSIVLSTLAVDLPAKALVSHYTPTQPLHPIPFLFSAEKDAEQWLNQVSSACSQFRGVEETPSACVLWAITSLGDIYLHDASSSEKELSVETRAAHCSLDVGEGTTPFLHPLERGFRPGCFVTVKGRVHEDAKRFNIDLMLDETSMNIALHVNPRFSHKVVVMNTREHNVWSYEEKASIKSIGRGKDCEITILCDDRDMKISISDKLFYSYKHRVMPWDITHIRVEGGISLTEVVYNYGAGDRSLCEFFWRGTGGHLRVVEAGAGGVTWGLSYDAHVYTFTGVCGGGIYKGNGSERLLNVMSDIRHVHVWENQRWNPITGFTNRGLPTDRKTWSDASGRHERTKEGTKLPSRHWQWISDWTVDHHPPNGSDKEGWQYATDFPMSYHGHRYVTDLVRRRRWVRKCRISTSGPWRQMEKVALISISVSPHPAENGEIPVWGVSASHEVVMREGVTPRCPRGNRWSLIPSETPMKEICAGIEGGVWAVSCTGQAHLRIGVTKINPKGFDWVNIDAPDVPLKQVGIGSWKVWAVDREGGLYHRLNVQQLFPEGTAWERICGDVQSISVGADGSLWAVLQCFPTGEKGATPGESSGVLGKRNGITKEVPEGTGWDICSGTGWSHISARIPIIT